jgi:hypothetical protein
MTDANFRQQGIWFRRQCRKCDYLYHGTYQKKADKLPIIMLQSARHRAKRDGLPCTIKAQDIQIPERCPVFGIKLEIGTRKNHEAAPSLDKIIPHLGYIPGNIRVMSHKANWMKNNATLAELKMLVAYLDVPSN